LRLYQGKVVRRKLVLAADTGITDAGVKEIAALTNLI